MPVLARGAALVDASGTLVTADAGFLRTLALPAPPCDDAWSGLAAREVRLPTFLRGQGPAVLALAGAGGAALTLERHPAPGGVLLVLRAEADDERLEHAARSQGLALLTAGLSHDVAGPLNTMTLQLALLEERLGGDPAARHLGALRDQIGRVDRVVRRFRDLVEPPTPPGGLDLATLAAEVLALFAHDLLRRSIRVAVEAAPGAVRTGASPARATLLVLGLVSQALADTPSAGVLSVSAAAAGGWATLEVSHTGGAPQPGLGYDREVAAAAAAALGGGVERASEEGRERVILRLPRAHQA